MEEARVPSTLIVDDEEDMRFLMRSTIEAANEGLEVTAEASDGFEAVERWREVQPDVVVMDNRMPGLTGLEAARRILAEDPNQSIILFSAFLNDEVRRTAEQIGVRVCLSKDSIFDLPDVLWSVSST
jgi:CheY-like chemotaxis protein